MALLEYKCPCCSGKLEFDSGIGKVKCPFCDNEFEMETFKQLDEELNEETTENLEWENESTDIWSEADEGMKAYSCKSCGAQIVLDENTSASKCPYCDSPVVMMGNLKGDLKPDLVIPFKLDKKAAMAAFEKHLTGKKLLPKVFTQQNHVSDITGIYVPYWIFNSDAEASIRYHATKSRKYTEGNFDCEEISHYAVMRRGYLAFENIPVDGSKKIENDLMESLEPFDFSEAKDFQTAYMAGFVADKYDVKCDECQPRANQRVKNSTLQEIRKTVQGYNSIEAENTNVNLSNGSAKYALLPVWILNTKWNDKNYIFAMNGQTGKFVGDLPCDNNLKKAASRAAGIKAAAIAIVVLFLIKFLGA